MRVLIVGGRDRTRKPGFRFGAILPYLHTAACLLAGVIPFMVCDLAHADEPLPIPIDRLAGQLLPKSDSTKSVTIIRDRLPYTVPLPAWVAFGDLVLIDRATHLQAKVADQVIDLEPPSWTPAAPQDIVPTPIRDFLSTLSHGITGPTQTFAYQGASRDVAACPAVHGTPPPLAAVQKLAALHQQIGADLPNLVVLWRPAPEPRLVRARLLRADGTILAHALSCQEPSIELQLQPNDLHAGDRLTLRLSDTHGGILEFTLDVVAPDSLPQPHVALKQDWLIATWRLAKADPGVGLDSVSRIAGATGTWFGAQRVMGAVGADEPF